MKENNRLKHCVSLGCGLLLCAGAIFAQVKMQSGDFLTPPNGEAGGHDISKQFDAVVKVDSGTKTLKNETIESNEDNKNAIFVQNDGVVNATGVKIITKRNGSRGLYAAFGGTINAKKVDVSTEGEHCAAFATDMGEGTVTVDSGKALTKGRGSPVIYSTGDISVKNITGTAENSELAVIEGKNSVTIEKSKLTGGSGLDGEVSAGVMLYQSMSGDANVGTAAFTAKISTLTNTAAGEKSAFFYVTNTNAVINLEATKLLGNTDTLILASGNDSRRGWGRKGANGGQVEVNFLTQTAKGDIIADEISSVKLNLGKKSSLTGAVNSNKGGKVDIVLEKTAKLEVTADSYFNIFADADESFKNIRSNGHTIFYNKTLEENKPLNGRTILLSDGGKIAPTEYDFTALETALASSEKGGIKMPPMGKPDDNNAANGETGGNGGKIPNGQPPKMELTTLAGTLNIVSDKAMLIDADNKATILKVMEERNVKNDNPPPMRGNAPNGGRPEMNGNPPNGQPQMVGRNAPGGTPPNPVTFEDLKKLSGKNVEIQGIFAQDGSLMVFTISQKK